MIVDQKLNKKIVGIYLIDGLIDGAQLATASKPNWVRRTLTLMFLGWKWVSIEYVKSKRQKNKNGLY